MRRRTSQHTEWLSLVESSGPFLAVSVLETVFPQGMAAIETPARRHVRSAYEEWGEAVDETDPLLVQLHQEWVRLVLADLLEFEEAVLADFRGGNTPFSVSSTDGTVSFSPDFVFTSGSGDKPKLFISVQPPGADLEKVRAGDGWPVSIVDRMALLCRSHDVRLGLLTNGERWMLVNAPVGSTSGHASWYARLWFQEPVTLQAFQSLLGVRRWFGPEAETLPAMLEASLAHHEEVTDTLGEQVKRAVEVLIQCLDRADQDRNRELLRDVAPSELYEAGLTVMMRLVFVLCAEERGLLLLDDPLYDQNYAESTLRSQLEEDADQHGPEVLERRHDAWARLLALFRAVYGGVEHEALRMPALGGSLFDPDRFAFLEGRAKGTKWTETPAQPLPIDNRTVLLLLTALQVLEQPGGALLLSYKALDVEQIGHVYEGLLEHTARRLPQVTLGLIGSQKAKNPNLPLAQLESAALDGQQTVDELVKEATNRSDSAIRKAMDKDVDDETFARVLLACGGDVVLAERIRPFANLLRTDARDEFIVYPENAFAVTLGADRRETGTHYTPKSLTESIVQTTLEPVVYVGPTEGLPREEWRLKSSAELLDLKVCDPAMGSGAFLVQVCRSLSERVVEAWGHEAGAGRLITVDGIVLDAPGESDPLPDSLDDRLTIARRLVAERCIYGVDLNPLAVELAKLSVWLVTLAKGRPFGFLDHNLRCGDSLLGLHRLDQLTRFSLHPDKTTNRSLFAHNVEDAVAEAMETRKRIRETRVRDIRDVWGMEELNREAAEDLDRLAHVADAMVGAALRCRSKPRELGAALNRLLIWVGSYLDGGSEGAPAVIAETRTDLATDNPSGQSRCPFHWALEFPEVISRGGFDAVVSNPPFLHGRRVSSTLGDAYRKWLATYHSAVNGSADLVAYFALRMFALLRSGGSQGFIATTGIAEGDTRETSLDWMLENGAAIAYANPDLQWPGTASVRVCTIVLWKGLSPDTPMLAGKPVRYVSSLLNASVVGPVQQPQVLSTNRDISFTGTYVYGRGFVLSEAERAAFLAEDDRQSERIRPYLRGRDINRDPEHKHSEWVIDFANLTESEARQWPLLFQHLERTVKVERSKQTKQIHESCFWKHWDRRPELYSRLSSIPECLVHAFVGKHVGFAFVSSDQVIAEPTAVFPTGSRGLFAVLQSSIHQAWVVERSSKMGKSIRYSVSDCFGTFALPNAPINGTIDTLGTQYEQRRKQTMQARQEGLTEIYNRLHDPEETATDIRRLQELQLEMDSAVAAAYGWDDLDLRHGFNETTQGTRFTISEAARIEILRRLLKLNHERYAEEAAGGLPRGGGKR